MRWDSLGVLGLVCRLYSEREQTGEEGQGGAEAGTSRVKEEVDDQQARSRSTIIERGEVAPQHDSSESEEEEFLEDENEYYWD